MWWWITACEPTTTPDTTPPTTTEPAPTGPDSSAPADTAPNDTAAPTSPRDTAADPFGCLIGAVTLASPIDGSTEVAPNDFASTCGGADAADRAYQFIAPTEGRYVFTLRNRDFEPVLSVRDTCAGPELACKPQPAVNLSAGQVVVVVVDGFAAEVGDFTLAATPIAPTEDCAVGLDEDLDSLLDCHDPDCFGSPDCVEDCLAGEDEDQDGLFDCQDPDCAAAAGCQPVCPDEALSAVPGQAVVTTDQRLDQVRASCAGPRAADVAVTFVAPADGRYVVTLRDVDGVSTASDLLGGSVAVLDGCGGVELACAVSTPGRVDAELVVTLVAGQTAAVVVDSASSTSSGEVEVVVRPATDVEASCADLVDDDGDGLRDCSDPDCAAACGPCPEQALVGAPATLVSTTASLGDEHSAEDCPGGALPDETVSFTAPSDGAYVFDTLGSALNTALAVRDGCYGEVLACDDSVYPPTEASVRLAAGQTVVLVVDTAGAYTLNVGAPAPVEVACDDGLDGDGDGDVDCADADCVCETCPDEPLGQAPLTWSGSTLGAPNEGAPFCAPSSAPDRSFAFTATETRAHTFDTFGSSFDTALTLASSCGSGSVLCNDDAGGTAQSELTYEMLAGETVVITVDGYFGQAGDVVLNVQ